LAVTVYVPTGTFGTRKLVLNVPLQLTGVLGVVTPIMVTTATAVPP
jgi:hypothetical protein